MTEKILLGNIITMDADNPRAEAVAIRDGIIVCVGNKEDVQKSVSESARVMDYSGYYVYPGFMEPHTHGNLAGYRAVGQADLSKVSITDYDEYARIIRKYIADNPKKEAYLAAGWIEDGTPIDYTYLDKICSDKPLLMNTGGGHSLLLNSKAMEVYGVNDELTAEKGTDLIHVGADGHPNGYICETPAIEIVSRLPISIEKCKEYILNWQDTALSKGITAVAEAGADLSYDKASDAYKELEDEGKLKLRTYSYLMVRDNPDDPEAEAERVKGLSEKYSGKYYKVIGIKSFLDGVIEAHTGWLSDDYKDQPGYRGVERFNDTDKMTKLIVAAQKRGLSVHVHCEGDGAAHFMLNCIEEAEKITGDTDQRNILAHLHLVSSEDIAKMASTHSIAAVAPLWVPKFPGEYEQEVIYIGEERAEKAYPIKSFTDVGAKIVFHSDYPISPQMDVSRSIFMAEMRGAPESEMGGVEKTKRGVSERITRQQSLEALTINVAYTWKAEDMLGSIENGKIANFAVADSDYLMDNIYDIEQSHIIATIVDGEEVYKLQM